MMAASYWIKYYHEILDDPKMATLPDRLWRRVSELFLLAGKENKGGHLPPTSQLAWQLRMQTDDLELDLTQLIPTGIIQRTNSGWFIPKFAARQSAAPAKERMAEMRERKQKRQYYEDVTNPLQNVTQITDTDQIQIRSDTEEHPLSKKYTDITGTLPHSLDKWLEAVQEMTRQGVTCDELEVAIKKLNDGGMTISGPWSCTKTAIWVHTQHKLGRPINSRNNGHNRDRPKPEVIGRSDEAEYASP